MIFFKPSNSVKFVKLTAGQKWAIPLVLADVSIDEACTWATIKDHRRSWWLKPKGFKAKRWIGSKGRNRIEKPLIGKKGAFLGGN